MGIDAVHRLGGRKMAKVFINPGHCIGVDPGAVNGYYQVAEAEIVADVGSMVKHYLTVAGVEAEILQSDNLCGENPRWPNVCNEANNSGADVFVSIHCNGAQSEAAQGTEVLVFSKWSRSDRLAECIQKQIVDAIGTVNRGVKARPQLAVLKHTRMPAVLVELAFITNMDDCELLITKKEEFAKAIARGITDFFTKE